MSNTTLTLKQNIFNLSDIHPKKNPAFSPNLYNWLRKHSFMQKFADRYKMGNMEYIGFLDDGEFLIGSRLWGVLCNGGAEEKFAFSISREPIIHIPMWENYLKIGRCEIDPKHNHEFMADRFSISQNSRICKWCGKIKAKEIYKVVTKKERWVNF
jgi:hypothetical protein